MYRRRGELEVFLVHPGGPFWAKKDAGAWSVPKGEIGAGEEPLQAAQREFLEETGFPIGGEFRPLELLKQSGGKTVHAWAVEGDLDPRQIKSNTFLLEWPKGSGRQKEFPEVDRAEWFDLAEAKRRILPSQAGFLDDLAALVEPRRP